MPTRVFGLVLKENDSIMKFVKNLDVKYEVQMCLVLFANDAKKTNHSKLFIVDNG